MNNFIHDIVIIASAFRAQLPFMLTIIAILWAINLLNAILDYRLNILGIHPRKWYGLPGIFCCPFLHSNFNHLFFNSIPLFVLANLVLLNGRPTFYLATLIIIILSGLGIWLFGKRGIHVGASALIMGYFGYLLSLAYKQPGIITIITAIVCLYYFGGLILSLFPGKKGVSWEGHICGLIAGIITAYIL